jgi:predicted RNase H-like HicB family nuclease
MTTPFLTRSPGPYTVSVDQQVDSTWIAACDRGDDGPKIHAQGESPAHALARLADRIAACEDECLDMFVEDLPRHLDHCRCHDTTAAQAAYLREQSGAEVRQTYRVGECCRCGRTGPIVDDEGVVIPYESSGAEVEDVDVVEFDPAESN